MKEIPNPKKQGPLAKRFAKKVEDFTCEHCGFEVKGNGYTNHCSKCLWSKHVDIGPGDRAAACQGLMKPTAIEGGTTDGYRVIHVCEKCKHKKANKLAPDDNQDVVLAIIKAGADAYAGRTQAKSI